MKYPFISRHRTVWSVSDLCLALGVSRSGFYEWHGRSPSARQCANERLISRIRESFQASDCTMAAPEYGVICAIGANAVADIAWHG